MRDWLIEYKEGGTSICKPKIFHTTDRFCDFLSKKYRDKLCVDGTSAVIRAISWVMLASPNEQCTFTLDNEGSDDFSLAIRELE